MIKCIHCTLQNYTITNIILLVTIQTEKAYQDKMQVHYGYFSHKIMNKSHQNIPLKLQTFIICLLFLECCRFL